MSSELPKPIEKSVCLAILFAPSLRAMDRAWRDAQHSGFARAPIIEMLIPSVVDDSLAPRGAHVASLFCQHFDPDPAGGWDALKPAAVEAVFGQVESYCPNQPVRRSPGPTGFEKLTVVDVTRPPVAADPAWTNPVPPIATVAGADWAEWLPAASYASTV